MHDLHDWLEGIKETQRRQRGKELFREFLRG